MYRTHHPVVRVHPETGERVLQLGQFVSRILGVNGQDSRDLLALYQRHITRQENIKAISQQSQVWAVMKTEQANLRRTLTQRYGVEF